MKTKKQNQTDELVHVVIPIPGKEFEAADDGLYDDCPVCQDLRKNKSKVIIEDIDEPRERTRH